MNEIDEFMPFEETYGFDDSGITEAYAAYKRILERNGMKPKSLVDIIRECTKSAD